jgi:hypothetical protein
LITQVVLDHPGGFYEYKIHNLKINSLCNSKYNSLASYLKNMIKECPNEYFKKGPRSSALKFNLPSVNLTHLNNYEVSELARLGLDINKERFFENHPKVQNFMLENDNKTIAIEVPLWLNDHELSLYNEIFNTKETLTGHIDILRVEGDKLWIWDYKPNAYKEKFASTQVYFYALMLSKRTGISLENFRCGYFDWKDTFIFSPENVKLINMKQSLMEFV